MKKNIVGLSIATWLVDLAMARMLREGAAVPSSVHTTLGTPRHILFSEAA